MCGICGIVNLASRAPADPVVLRAMMGRLRHRGPDASGYYRDNHAALGHTRLSIIDLSGGAQPMANEDRSLWISFNGEIFNYVELAAELASVGHRFTTRSDTEVILHAWEEWGPDAFRRMNGQWAIALWDARRREVILSRDRLGIRPLYYTVHDGRLLFASEVKAIFAHRAVPRRPDPAGLEEVFTFWSPVAPRTAFDGVRQLPPGEFARVSVGASPPDGAVLGSAAWWRPAFTQTERDLTLSELAEQLRERLLDAARLRFTRSDVPVGAYLSGGLDSSITSAVVSRYTQTPLKTFSIRFEDAEFDEGGYQDLMAKQLGTDHQGVVVSRSEIGRVFPDVIRHVERPILRAAPAPLFLLSRLVRSAGYKVVVTGEGADEVLAGYDIFREGKVREFVGRNPASALRPGIVTRLYPWMAHSPTAVPAFAQAFFSRNLDLRDPAISHRPRWDAAAGVRALLSPGFRDPASPPPVVDDLLARLPAEALEWDSLGRSQWLEMTTLLEGYILSAQGDRMLMANSVEGRFPFLDVGLVEFAGSLPARYKLMGLDEKHLLKVAFADLVPEEIVRRPKQPYRAPDAASFFSPEPEWLADLLAPDRVREAGLFSPTAVARLQEKLRKRAGEPVGNTDNMRAVAVISAMLWHEQMIRGNGGDGPADPPEPMTVTDLAGGADGLQVP